MKWHQVWAARFGDKFDNMTLSVWEEEMRNEISNLRQEEILDAVRTIGEQKRHGEIKYKPTLNHLISAIIRRRYIDRNHGHEQSMQTSTEERINTARHNIRRHMENGDKVEAWIVMCHHTPYWEIRPLEDWAEDELGFTRPTHEEMGTEPLDVIIRRMNLLGDSVMGRITDDIRTRARGQGIKHAYA